MNRIVYISILVAVLVGCKTSQTSFKNRWVNQKAPATFKARFETTRGVFDIESNRNWSPQGVDRLYQLIRFGYYSNIPIYRVVPNFVAQFGTLDTTLSRPWEKIKLDDEPVIESNQLGTMAFARGGKRTRAAQVFINIANNQNRLDTLGTVSVGVPGFPVIAKITKGLEVATSFFSYNDEPRRNMKRNVPVAGYLQNEYPQMDYINKAYIIK